LESQEATFLPFLAPQAKILRILEDSKTKNSLLADQTKIFRILVVKNYARPVTREEVPGRILTLRIYPDTDSKIRIHDQVWYIILYIVFTFFSLFAQNNRAHLNSTFNHHLTNSVRNISLKTSKIFVVYVDLKD